MKRLMSYALLAMVAVCSSASVSITLSPQEKNGYEYFTANVFTHYVNSTRLKSYFLGNEYDENDGRELGVSLSNSAKTTVKMRVRGDFMEKFGYGTRYSASEFTLERTWVVVRWSYPQFIESLKYPEVTVRCKQTLKEVGSDVVSEAEGSFTLRKSGGNDYSDMEYPIACRPLCDGFPALVRLEDDKWYDYEVTFEHDFVGEPGFSLWVCTDNRQDAALHECIQASKGDTENYMTVVREGQDPQVRNVNMVLGATKDCNVLYSGTINFTDENNNPITTDPKATASQVNGHPVVRLYDINDKKWIGTAIMDDSY